jgi:predicted nucleic acid-binding protein
VATEIFIDTGAWLALVNQKDPYYQIATAFYPRLKKNWPTWLTTNMVVSETYVNLYRGAGYPAAIRFLDTLASTPNLLRVSVDWTLEQQAEQILRQYKDQDFSYVDAVSFAVMQHREITEAFAFDHHFSTMGFTRVV